MVSVELDYDEKQTSVIIPDGGPDGDTRKCTSLFESKHDNTDTRDVSSGQQVVASSMATPNNSSQQKYNGRKKFKSSRPPVVKLRTRRNMSN